MEGREACQMGASLEVLQDVGVSILEEEASSRVGEAFLGDLNVGEASQGEVACLVHLAMEAEACAEDTGHTVLGSEGC